jgi:hypothetical protein
MLSVCEANPPFKESQQNNLFSETISELKYGRWINQPDSVGSERIYCRAVVIAVMNPVVP